MNLESFEVIELDKINFKFEINEGQEIFGFNWDSITFIDQIEVQTLK